MISIHALCEEGDVERGPSFASEKDFYPRPLRGGRRWPLRALYLCTIFLSTPSARRATASGQGGPCAAWNFYPRPLRGGRHGIDFRRLLGGDFYPRPLRGGRRLEELRDMMEDEFLSTPSARRATGLGHAPKVSGRTFLSTPSARRATSGAAARRSCSNNFYPRPLRGGRPASSTSWWTMQRFLSTPSARRATPLRPAACCVAM